MHDVFKILDVGADDVTLGATTKDLFADYATITEKEVARSNKWFATWPESDTFRENLKLSFQFLENNITERLWDKCLEAYDNYKPQERGGPLLFIIMMKRLQVDTDTAVEYLRNSIKTMKVTNFDGEDVSRVVSLIRGVWKRLKGVGENKVPTDFAKQILAVFQTSTVPEFNSLFEHYSTSVEVKTRTDPGKDHWPSPDVLFEMAEAKYLELHQIDKWSGVTTKANQSVFNAAGGGTITRRCFNCGSPDHSLPKCPKPRNEQQIEQRKKAFQSEKEASNSNKSSDGKKKSDGSRKGKKGKTVGKFAEPTPSEKNRRKIDGKWFTYNTEKKRWFVEKSGGNGANGNAPAPAAQQAAAGSPTPSTTPPVPPVSTTPTPAGTDTVRAVREAAISNATQAITIAMRGMADAYRDN